MSYLSWISHMLRLISFVYSTSLKRRQIVRLKFLQVLYINQLRLPGEDSVITKNLSRSSHHKPTCKPIPISGRTQLYTWSFFSRTINDWNKLQPQILITTVNDFNSPDWHPSNMFLVCFYLGISLKCFPQLHYCHDTTIATSFHLQRIMSIWILSDVISSCFLTLLSECHMFCEPPLSPFDY